MKYVKIIAGIWTVVVSAMLSCNVEWEIYENRNRKPIITLNTQPAETTYVTVGAITGSLSVSAEVTQNATLIYQWYSNTTNSNIGGTSISNATSVKFTIPVTLTTGTYYYFCEILTSDEASSVRSNVATVYVQALPAITIHTQPAEITNVTIDNISGSLSVSASVTQSATLSYQWYSNTTSSNTGGTLIQDETSDSFTIPITLTEGTYYYFCEVSANDGAFSVRSSVATVIVQVETSLTIEMVSVQGGTFMMGSPAGVGFDNERPQYQVTLNNFSIGKYQITQEQWVAVMGSNPSTFKGNKLPVEMVSWNDIVGTSGTSMVLNGITYREDGFVYKLNQLTDKIYRLPTEAEWEYAARGGNKSQGFTYSGSNIIDDVAWYYDNSGNSTKSVGTKEPNELGIYDMSGNVWEWCSDWYGNYTAEYKTNPTGPASGSNRVNRGGCWYYDAAISRITSRNYGNPNNRDIILGFRLVSSSTSGTLPMLSTTDATNITTNSATLGGNIIYAGNPPYNERGVVYDTNPYPTIANNKTEINGTGTGSFSTNVSDLTPNTIYYVRAYAINTEGEVYGTQVSFKTNEQIVPEITINTQPVETTNVTVGNISGSLTVSANVTQSATLNYQWYSNSTNSNTGGMLISGAISANFPIPATLTMGTYYYFCEVSATGANSVRSSVATVIVQPATSVTIEMVSVQGGTFTMGCIGTIDGTCYSSELPMHEVTLSSFSIGKYEVTQAQWVAVMDNFPSYNKGVDLPVETVSWNDIVGTSGASVVINGITYYENGFIYKLNQLTGKIYRLPTEAEWEYAARGGNQSNGYTYSGSNTIGNVAWYSDNSGNSTKSVGTKASNELGIYDMSGNVWEWCSDWYGSYTSEATTNPTGPTSGSYRVIRGGSWDYDAMGCRVPFRINFFPESGSNYLGFRLAMSL